MRLPTKTFRFARLLGSVLALAAAACVVAPASGQEDAEDVPTRAHLAKAEEIDVIKVNEFYAEPGKPNLAGFWRPRVGVPRLIYTFADGTPLPRRETSGTQYGIPYKPEWQAAYMARRRSDVRNIPYGDPAAMCWPQGMYKNYIGYGSPIEVTQTQGRVQIAHERLSEVHDIYTDGRPLPPLSAIVPTAEGTSVGHWEGDTLVAVTTGVRREFTLGTMIPHSEEVKFTERFRRIDPVTLYIDILIEDPKAMTMPIRTNLTYSLWLDDEMSEDFCVENNRNQPDENLVIKINLEPRKHYGFDLPLEEDDGE